MRHVNLNVRGHSVAQRGQRGTPPEPQCSATLVRISNHLNATMGVAAFLSTARLRVKSDQVTKWRYDSGNDNDNGWHKRREKDEDSRWMVNLYGGVGDKEIWGVRGYNGQAE